MALSRMLFSELYKMTTKVICVGSRGAIASLWIRPWRCGVRRRKNDTAPAPELFFRKHGSSSGALGFHECSSGSGALFFIIWLVVFTH